MTHRHSLHFARNPLAEHIPLYWDKKGQLERRSNADDNGDNDPLSSAAASSSPLVRSMSYSCLAISRRAANSWSVRLVPSSSVEEGGTGRRPMGPRANSFPRTLAATRRSSSVFPSSPSTAPASSKREVHRSKRASDLAPSSCRRRASSSSLASGRTLPVHLPVVASRT